MVYGDPLEAPILIRGWHENDAFQLSLGPPFQPDHETLLERPSLMLAHYAGAEWVWLESDDAVPDIDHATYYGRFFPAVRDHPAIVQIYQTGELLAPVVRTTLTVGGSPVEVVVARQARLVGHEGRAILDLHGVPTRVDHAPAAISSTGEVDLLVLAVVTVLASALVIAALVTTGAVRRRSPRQDDVCAERQGRSGLVNTTSKQL